jgi:hypothetical protein
MLEVADILRDYGQAYLDKHGAAVPRRHQRVIHALVACRTAELGGHLYVCDRCSHPQYAYHSCRNRHCPKCHGSDVEAWLTARRSELLPAPYFHLVFTLPEALRRIVRQHQHVLYPVLMRSAGEALQKLAKDPRYVGGQIGMLSVLHTWTRTLEYHPHVHALVPGGGLTADGRWLAARKKFLVPVKALSRLFRGIFMDHAKQALPDQVWPSSVWKQEWVVFAKATLRHPETVLRYLGRYVHRVALSNSNIVAIDDGRVTFRYRRVGHRNVHTMTLAAHEFIRRFLQHVLPDGFHKVRYYGLWAPANRTKLRQLQETLRTQRNVSESKEVCQPQTDADQSEPSAAGSNVPVAAVSNVPTAAVSNERPPGSLPVGQPRTPASEEPRRCPKCHEGHLRWVAHIPRGSRAPP